MEPEEERYWIDTERFGSILDVVCDRPWARITFDDGNASDATRALPALLARGLTATFFVVAGRIDQVGSLSSSDIRTLVESGMKVGSHGMLHRPWRHLSDADLRIELVDARAIIAEVAGCHIREAAFPRGAYDRRVLKSVRRCGFTHVYTVDEGPARSGAWVQSRYTIRRDDTASKIAQMANSPRGTRRASAIRSGKSLIKRLR